MSLLLGLSFRTVSNCRGIIFLRFLKHDHKMPKSSSSCIYLLRFSFDVFLVSMTYFSHCVYQCCFMTFSPYYFQCSTSTLAPNISFLDYKTAGMQCRTALLLAASTARSHQSQNGNDNNTISFHTRTSSMYWYNSTAFYNLYEHRRMWYRYGMLWSLVPFNQKNPWMLSKVSVRFRLREYLLILENNS